MTGPVVDDPGLPPPAGTGLPPAADLLGETLQVSPKVATVVANLHLPPVPPVPLVNIANALTTLRLVLVPFFLLLLFAAGGHADGWRIGAFAAFAVSATTDLLDGKLARSRGLVTDFGIIADPIADKLLVGSALVGLNILGDLPAWVTVVIVVRELGVTALRFAVVRHEVIPASRGGKLKALAQNTAVGLYVLPLPGLFDVPLAIWMGVALVLTVVTGLDYVVKVRNVRRKARL